MTMTDETQAAMPVEDAPGLPVETDSSPVTDAQPETEAKQADDAQPRDEDGKFLSKKAQERIDALTREKYERAREAEYWRNEALKYQKPAEPQQQEPITLPKLEDFAYDEAKYQAALIQYATKQAEEVVNRRLSEADKQRAEQARIESFVTRQKEFAKATPDFEDRVLRDPTLPITEAMRDVIVDSPSGPELAYYLATNRDLAEQIASLPPHLAALEMGRIDGRLQAQKEARRAPLVTKAPPPPPKVEEAETTVTRVKATDPESDKISDSEWMRLRNQELKRKKA